MRKKWLEQASIHPFKILVKNLGELANYLLVNHRELWTKVNGSFWGSCINRLKKKYNKNSREFTHCHFPLIRNPQPYLISSVS